MILVGATAVSGSAVSDVSSSLQRFVARLGQGVEVDGLLLAELRLLTASHRQGWIGHVGPMCGCKQS